MSIPVLEPVPSEIVMTDGLEALVDTVRRAATDRTPLQIRGGNSKSWYGHPVDGARLETRAHSGIVDYEPSELVLVARAGTPLQQIETLLARHRQQLAFEPPRFGSATLGGCVSTGLSGPRRMAAGAVRDFVLGARLIDGRGQTLAFGGKVMKNVAGYDVSRALVGSLGMLGVITEVSLKVLPIPAQRVTLAFPLDEQRALDQMNQWAGQPIAITATAWLSQPSLGGDYAPRGGRLLVRLEGSEAAVQSGIRRLGGLALDPQEADGQWRDLREQTASFFATRSPDASLWRLALPPTAPALDAARLHIHDQLIEWGGAQRWFATTADPQEVRDAAARLGGHAVLWRATPDVKARHGVFAPLSAPLLAIHRRLKTEFDPDRLFNRGRSYPDL